MVSIRVSFHSYPTPPKSRGEKFADEIDFGQSYASKTLDKASEYYQGEIECVNSAAKVARALGAKGKFVLSVGATPTAHAATQTASINEGLEGELELYVTIYCPRLSVLKSQTRRVLLRARSPTTSNLFNQIFRRSNVSPSPGRLNLPTSKRSYVRRRCTGRIKRYRTIPWFRASH